MSPVAITYQLTKGVKRFIGINTLFLTIVIPSILLSFDSREFTIGVVLLGVLLGVWNHLFVQNYYVPRVESVLVKSYEKLENSLSFDELTGVYTRRTGMVRLREEFARSRRTGEDLTIAMLDIDHFKEINDTYGHQVGDFLLEQIASTIRSELRENDVIFRYGGEEFVIILPDINQEQALFPLDRLRKKLSQQVYSYNEEIKITRSVSIGLTSLLPEDDDESSLISRADAALYKAKNLGRNRVAFDTSSMLTDRHEMQRSFAGGFCG